MLNPEIYAKVRLKPEYLDIIAMAFKNNFMPTDRLWIFGSRVNLQARGGDIDLYVETTDNNSESVYARKSKFISELWKNMGEQKIDVVLNMITDELSLPIYDVAIKHGVRLI